MFSPPLPYQEEYLRAEMRALSREVLRAAEEINRIKAVPLTLGTFVEMIDEVRARAAR